MNIFVAAMDWGLGHTTRIIPVIYNLRNEGNRIIIGASAKQIPIYKEHFPDLEIISISSASPILGRGKNQIFRILLFLPRFFIGIISDRFYARKMFNRFSIEKIVSDNRYGLRSKKTYNIIITHQVNVQLPKSVNFIQPLVQNIIHRFIRKFDECNIPDFAPPDNIAGLLSNSTVRLSGKIKYIGILSRLQVVEPTSIINNSPEILFIISGPEHQRTIFEHRVVNEIEKLKNIPSYTIIRGLPNKTENNLKNSLNHADSATLKSLILNARYIICRAGYSTIMDLVYLNKTAMLVPTPGQSEQEYLAHYLREKRLFLSVDQDKLSLSNCLTELDKFTS